MRLSFWLFPLVVCCLLELSRAAMCKSGEYCPQHWRVLRRPDQSAHTCDPMNGNTKCPKPYQCMHSKCGIAFCCVHSAMYDHWQREHEETLEAEYSDDDDDEL